MGESGIARTGGADFTEPSPIEPVIGNGTGQDRRPGPPGASRNSEANHEVPPDHPQAALAVCPEDADRAGGCEKTEGPAPSCFRLLPPPSLDQTQGDRSAGGRSVDAGRPARNRRGGRPPRKWTVRVRAVDLAKYPQFLRNPHHPFACMKLEDRIEDLISFCARLWARTCEDVARVRQPTKLPAQERVKAA